MKNLNEYDLYVIAEDGNKIYLADSLSKLSRMAIKLLVNGLQWKNSVMVTLPNSNLRIIPYLSYYFGDVFNKDVAVISDQKKINFHLENLSRLYSEKEGQIYNKIIPFTKTKNLKFFFDCPINVENLDKPFDIFVSDDKIRKLFFFDNILDISLEQIKNEKFANKKSIVLNQIKSNIGLVVFEDVDIYSSIYSKSLIGLIKNLNLSKIKVIIHISNPYTDYIKELYKQLKCSILYFDKQFFVNSKEDLFNPMWEKKNNLNFRKLEIDRTSNYVPNYEILPPITVGNLDHYYNEFKKLVKKNEEKLKNHMDVVYTIKRRFMELYNSAAHPSTYKFNCSINGEFHYDTSIDELVTTIDSRVFGSDETVDEIILYLLSNLKSFYLEIKQSKRYFEEKSFERKCKNYEIIKLIKKLDVEENKHLTITILCSNAYEKKAINNDLARLKLEYIYGPNINPKVVAECIWAEENAILIAPSFFYSVKDFAMLINNFEKVYFITYGGNNLTSIKKQEKIYNSQEFTVSREWFTHDYFKTIRFPESKIPQFLKPSENLINIKNNIFTETELNKEEFIIQENTSPKTRKKADYKLEFQEIKTRIYRTRSYAKDERLLKFGKEIGLTHLNNIKKGDIILGIEPERNLLELLCEIFGVKHPVDLETLKKYYNALTNYINSSGIKLLTFYQEYAKKSTKPKSFNEFRLWMKQSIIGPEFSQDIKALGLAMTDEFLIYNYDYIFAQMESVRKNHIEKGKILSKFINKITDRKQYMPETMEEYILYENLPMYVVKSIIKK